MLPPLDHSLPALHLHTPPLTYRIYSVPLSAPLPAALLSAPPAHFLQLTRSSEGQTVVHGSPPSPPPPSGPADGSKDDQDQLRSLAIEGGDEAWRGIAVRGPLDLSMVGILSRLSGVLADASINLYVCSTW